MMEVGGGGHLLLVWDDVERNHHARLHFSLLVTSNIAPRPLVSFLHELQCPNASIQRLIPQVNGNLINRKDRGVSKELFTNE